VIADILQGYTTTQHWSQAPDAAFCDILADQFQVLVPDEIDAPVLVLTRTGDRLPCRIPGYDASDSEHSLSSWPGRFCSGRPGERLPEESTSLPCV